MTEPARPTIPSPKAAAAARRAAACLACVVGLGLITPGAGAQDAPIRTPAKEAQHQTVPPPLSGPKVETTRVPGSNSLFSQDMQQQRGTGRQVPMRVYLRSVRELEQDPELALSPEQQQQVRAIASEHTRATREFWASHADELKAMGIENITGQARPRGEGNARRPDRPNQAGGPDGTRGTDALDRPGRNNAEARSQKIQQDLTDAQKQRLKELRAKAPAATDTQTRIYALLNDDQRAAVQQDIEAWSAEQRSKQEQRYLEQQKNNIREQGPAAVTPEQARDRFGSMDIPDNITDEMLESLPLPDRLKNRLEPMSPQDRAKALQRLRDRSRERAG